MEQVISRPVCALLGLIIVAAGLAGGIYMGPMRDHAAVAGWTPYVTAVSTQGKAIGANNEALDTVTFRVNGQDWGANLVLPGAWPKGAKFTSWVRWRPLAIQITNPTGFRVSSVVWPIIGFALGWILALSSICRLSQYKRPPRQEPRQGIRPRTGVV